MSKLTPQEFKTICNPQDLILKIRMQFENSIRSLAKKGYTSGCVFCDDVDYKYVKIALNELGEYVESNLIHPNPPIKNESFFFFYNARGTVLNGWSVDFKFVEPKK